MMAGALVVIAVVVVVGFVLLVSLRYRQEQRRTAGWAAEAARLGLDHERGDPLALAGRLGVDEVTETVSGTVDGVRVAALTVSKVRSAGTSGPDRRQNWFTWSVGVALDAAGPGGAPVVVDREPRGMHLTEAPLRASELEGLLRETAAAGRARA